MSDLSLNINEKIQLRQLNAADATQIFELIENNRTFLRQWLNWVDQHNKLEDTKAFIEKTIQQTERQEGITFGILHEQALIGTCNLYDWNHSLQKATIGIWIDGNFTKKGIATLCIGKLLEYSFEQLQLQKVEIVFENQNTASRRIAEHFNFKIEGFLRRSFLIHGQLKDIVIAGLLKEEHITTL